MSYLFIKPDTTPLDELRDWSAELNVAIACRPGWERVVTDAVACVAAAHVGSFVTVVGTGGRWRVCRFGRDGAQVTDDEVYESAGAAVEAVAGPAEVRIGPSARRRIRRAAQVSPRRVSSSVR